MHSFGEVVHVADVGPGPGRAHRTHPEESTGRQECHGSEVPAAVAMGYSLGWGALPPEMGCKKAAFG
ncbi:hypothetical protein GCM10018790_62800 [Kitasatospora xanthocidica]|nr:hypothetical protein GCM10018790_62800 [Kitasatospora xanthocidica]